MKFILSLLFIFQVLQGCSQEIPKNNLPKIEVSNQLIKALNNTSSILKRNTSKEKMFKIQFYGQSIVSGINVNRISTLLEKTYPNVEFEVINNAIGGYQAPKLVRTAEHDLYPQYADLIVFHVYGGVENGELEEMFSNIKNRLTSDVVIFDHHLSYVDNDIGQERLNEKQDKESKMIEYLAYKYNFGFVGVRDAWKSYLKLNSSLTIKDLLRDNVHPNEEGKVLLEWILMEHLIDAIKKNKGDYKNINEFVISEDTDIIKFEFSGNRLDILPDKKNMGAEFSIRINEIPIDYCNSLYAVSRPSSFPKQWWPAFNRITLNKSVVQIEEKWTVFIRNFNNEYQTFDFELVGAVSGYQGKGKNGEDFISSNKAIKILASDMAIFPFNGEIKEYDKKNLMISFNVYPLFTNPITIEKLEAINLARLLDNKKHTIELNITKGTLLNSKILIHQPDTLKIKN